MCSHMNDTQSKYSEVWYAQIKKYSLDCVYRWNERRKKKFNERERKKRRKSFLFLFLDFFFAVERHIYCDGDKIVGEVALNLVLSEKTKNSINDANSLRNDCLRWKSFAFMAHFSYDIINGLKVYIYCALLRWIFFAGDKKKISLKE